MGLNKKVKDHERALNTVAGILQQLESRIKVLEAKLAKEENKGVAH